MANIPFDSVQYCETEEALVNGSSVPLNIKNGENYIGVYNFNPGYDGSIKTLSLKTKIDWVNPSAIPLSGTLYLKARQYDQSTWQILDSYNFNSTEEINGEVNFSLIMVSGETNLLSGLSQTPLILAVSGVFFDVGEELLGDELITNYNFASGEDNWEFSPTTDIAGNPTVYGRAYPDRMFLTGNASSSVNYQLTRFEPAVAESAKFNIVPGKRYKFTTYSPQLYNDSETIQNFRDNLARMGLEVPKVKLSLSGEAVINTKAKDRLLYEWGFNTKTYGSNTSLVYGSITYLERNIPAWVKIADSEEKYNSNIKYGKNYELVTYLNPQCTELGESALIIKSTGNVSLDYSLGMPFNLTYRNLTDCFNYISLKEVSQEGTGTSGITLQPSALIVRCMGETA